MEAVAAAGLFLVGLVLMIRGGGLFVEASVDLAEAWGVPRFLVGATVVSLATTLPEITVSALGVLQGKADLAVGNAVGSVTANLGLILGLCVLVSPPAVRRGTFAPRALAMVLAAALLGLVSRGGVLTWLAGLPLLVLFALFVRGSIREARSSVLEAPLETCRSRVGTARIAPRFLLGLGGILLGSQLLIRQGTALAALMGVSEGVVGVTLVAVGTSLPELVTAVSALVRRETALSVGNLVGANLIDLSLILPLCAILAPSGVPISGRTLGLDLPVCLGLCVLATVPPLLEGRYRRWQGALLLGLYGAYLAVLAGK